MGKFEDLKKSIEEKNKDLPLKRQEYISRTKAKFCKQEGCDNPRRQGSAYC